MRVPSMFNLSGDMLTVMIRAAPSFMSLLGLFIRYTDQVLCGFSCCELASIAFAPKYIVSIFFCQFEHPLWF